MILRKAEERDLAALAEIYNNEVMTSTATLDLHPRSMEDRMEWLKSHNVGNHPLIVAEEDGVVMGYASLSGYREKEAYKSTVELSVYVHPDHRCKGVATAMVNELLRMAREDENTHLVVSVITGGNEKSRRLHERFGFIFSGNVPEAGFKMGEYRSIDTYYMIV